MAHPHSATSHSTWCPGNSPPSRSSTTPGRGPRELPGTERSGHWRTFRPCCGVHRACARIPDTPTQAACDAITREHGEDEITEDDRAHLTALTPGITSSERVADLEVRRAVAELPFYLRPGYHVELAADGWVLLACGCVWITGSSLNPATPPPPSSGVCAGQVSRRDQPRLASVQIDRRQA